MQRSAAPIAGSSPCQCMNNLSDIVLYACINSRFANCVTAAVTLICGASQLTEVGVCAKTQRRIDIPTFCHRYYSTAEFK